MKILKTKDIEITNSNSKLGFSTTGGGSWKVWDRFITYDNKQLFHIGNICGTCNFFFTRKEITINGNLTSDQIAKLLNKGINTINVEEIKNISSILPNGNYKLVLSEITPSIAFPTVSNDYFTTDLYESWNSDQTNHTNTEYFRGTAKKIKENEKLFEFFIPLYPVNQLDAKCVADYENKILKGDRPTVLALGVLDVKTSMVYPEINGEEIEPEILSHWCFANYLIDGHHKLMAANNLNKPITLLTFVSKDHSWQQIDEMLAKI